MPGAFAEPFHNPFPAARGVLVRFAGEAVAGKFVFERVEAPDSRAEVSARDASGAYLLPVGEDPIYFEGGALAE
ncbi:MAG: hypothetical protein ILM98_06940 [Kiritimatiellae bacterium]|nr:hypothetical protein [Kiritimatiellia bacterium]